MDELADAQLLIADGHHRYETALAFHEEDGTEASAWLLAVIVPTGQEGLTIFPTHRVAAERRHRLRARRSTAAASTSPGRCSIARARTSCSRATGSSTRRSSTGSAPRGVTYTPRREEAVATVDRGEAEAAFLLRPTRIEDVWSVARRGDVMPQKSTFFYPKLTSGLLMLPLD